MLNLSKKRRAIAARRMQVVNQGRVRVVGGDASSNVSACWSVLEDEGVRVIAEPQMCCLSFTRRKRLT